MINAGLSNPCGLGDGTHASGKVAFFIKKINRRLFNFIFHNLVKLIIRIGGLWSFNLPVGRSFYNHSQIGGWCQ